MRLYALSTLFCFISFVQAYTQCLTSNRPGIHVVKPNENLYRISRQYNVSLENLCRWNNIKADELLPACKELVVSENVEIPKSFEAPVGVTAGTPVPRFQTYQRQAGTSHVVQPGESLAGLAELYGYTEKRFREFNAIGPYEKLTPGSIILSTDCPCGRISYSTETGFRPGDTPSAGTTTQPTDYNTLTGPVNEKPDTPSNDVTSATSPAITGGYGSMRPEEISMVNEINLIRSNPRGYVSFVQEYVDDQKRKNEFPVSEGAVRELINDLNRMEPLSFLEPRECLYNAAKNHGRDLLRQGKADHRGSDGSWPWDRILKECPGMTDGNENLIGGPADVREAVMILLIDDDIPTRGHRRTILNPKWKYIACYKIGTLGMMPNSWVQNFGY